MRRSSVPVRVDVADANELVLSLGAAAERGDAARVREFSPSSWMWTHLVSVAAETPRPRDASALLMRLDRVPAAELQRRLVGYYTSWFRELTPAAVMDRALRGDATAVRQFLASSMPEDPAWSAALERRLDAGAARTKHDLLEIVDEWERRVFRPIAPETMRVLRRAMRDTRRRADERVLRAFVGCEPVTDPGTRVVVVPSVVIGDEIHEFDHHGTLFFCVPVERAERPRSELSALVGALADDSRGAIVSALAHDDLTAQALADRVGIGLSTTLHHLATLRRAGLVERGGRRTTYALRRAPLRRLRDVVGGLVASGA